MKRTLPLILIILCTVSLFAQDRKPVTAIFGKISQADYEFSTYDQDPNAAAVILYESGFSYFKEINNRILLIKTVHRKIKVLDASRFDMTEVDVSYYHNGNSKEEVKNIEALTHNGTQQTRLEESAIYDIDLTERISLKRFTFPNIKDGSILEYRYEIQSPYFFNFGDWDFQESLPKLYSEFKAHIPANFVYKRSLKGKKALDIEISKIKKSCFDVYILDYSSDCESLTYAMFDIPAYEEEPYMLAIDNYISRLSFEYTEYINFEGKRKVFSKTWEDVDREFKKEKDIGKQLTKTSFFEDKLPAAITTIKNPLEKAKKIYSFIQDHFLWDGTYRIFSEIRVKEAFTKKTGNIAEINLSLINALQASGLDAQLALGSTRDNGFMSDLYPVLTEFNYVFAHLKIGDKTYLLDATDKRLPFDMLPFNLLNGRARVMDFDNGSSWTKIIPQQRNINYYNYNLTLSEDLEIEGVLKAAFTGYEAYDWRTKLDEKDDKAFAKLGKDQDIELFEPTFDDDKNNNNKPLKVTFKVTSEAIEDVDFYYINPLLMNFDLLENPFDSSERQYPVDLGYPSAVTYDFTLKIPESFEITNLPESKRFELEGNKGSCTIFYEQSPNKLHCIVRFNLLASFFETTSYPNLQAFLSGIIDEHRNAVVKIKTH